MSNEQLTDGLYEEALNTVNKLIDSDTANANNYLLRANIFYNLIKYDDAIKDCYTALRIEPDKPEIYYVRGQVCMVTKSYGGALLFFGKALKYTRDSNLIFNAYLNRGEAYFALSKYSDALDDYKKASEMKPVSLELFLTLAKTYDKLRNTDKAIIYVEKVIEIDPEEPRAYELLGKISIENKDYNKAIEALEKYSSLKSDDASVFLSLADVYLQLKDYDKALLTVNRSLAINPEEPYCYKIRGLVYYQRNLYNEGCNNLFRAFQLGYIEKYGYDLLEYYQQHCEKE